ncbi:TRAP transporter substrate-binding protein DctP [Polyangium mundeleinium]|uniref:TRAP transporter substrate-binding protein DctP n=1 Tax=Polyangium mundeleinium TaxID=2995306 RepID=A0ABT5F5R2_9BACT|nr:TRAP transporter substrate-binding protein DctP [Polyangium mundeleinium]MDC0748436.1 TRAP transporter substrate-binding protein DctP [Polyangium mundeleinium]
MMLRRAMVKLLGALTVLAGIGASQDASAAEVITIGTLAPKSSPWGQVFSVWEKAVAEKSGGRLELRFYYNGQQGDEAAMVGKMKSGQLDGAAVTAVGLGKVHKPILALQMPGLFSSWAKLDAARETMRPEFEKGAEDAGFRILGWGDVGQAHLITKGVAVRTPDDFKGTKPYVWRDDAVMPVFFQVIGGVTPVPLGIPEVLPNLGTGAVNALVAPALVAEQLQWASKLDTIVADASGFAVGALVLSSKKLDALPADLKTILQDTGKVAATALTKRIRSEDDAAFGRLKGKMTVVELTADQKTKWQGLFKQVRSRLSQGTFSPDLVAKLEGLGG